MPSTDGSRLLRYDPNGGELVIFDAATLAPLTTLTLRNLSEPLLSPDGRYILAQWYDEDRGEYTSDRAITVFDAATGRVVETGSEQPLGYGGARTYGWLPDGRYIYIIGAEIWVTAPNTPDASDVAISWPEFDQEHGVVVQSITDGTPGLLAICGGTISWMP